MRELFPRQLRIERRNIRFEIAPNGRGSAAHWVVKRYPQVVAKARATQHQQTQGFLVVVDGDNAGVAQRKRSLHGKHDQRAQADRIAIWVPTWSVETWVLWLCEWQIDGKEVDERQSYKNEVDPQEYRDLLRQ